MRCAHCPRPPGTPCRGESHGRLCELRDPTGPAFNRDYLRPIPGETLVEGEEEPRLRPRPALTEAERERGRRFFAMHRCDRRTTVPGRCSDCVGHCADRGGEVVEAAVCLACDRTLEA